MTSPLLVFAWKPPSSPDGSIRHGVLSLLVAALSLHFVACSLRAEHAGRHASHIRWKKDGAEMVIVPAGEFLFGPERVRRSLQAFYIDRFEVTNAQFANFLEWALKNDPCAGMRMNWGTSLAIRQWYSEDGVRRLKKAPSLPASRVYWEHAVAYAEWAGKRIPREDEWEKAARGTDGRIYPWGDGWADNRAVTMASTARPRGPLPVGSRPLGASPYGCLDMIGNVWEWASPLTATQFSRKLPWKGRYDRILLGGAYFLSPGYGYDQGNMNFLSFEARFHAAGCSICGERPGFRCVVLASEVKPGSYDILPPLPPPPAKTTLLDQIVSGEADSHMKDDALKRLAARPKPELGPQAEKIARNDRQEFTVRLLALAALYTIDGDRGLGAARLLGSSVKASGEKQASSMVAELLTKHKLPQLLVPAEAVLRAAGVADPWRVFNDCFLRAKIQPNAGCGVSAYARALVAMLVKLDRERTRRYFNSVSDHAKFPRHWVFVLGEIADERDIPTLTSLAMKEEEGASFAFTSAFAALGRIGTPAGIEAMGRLALEAPSEEVRRAMTGRLAAYAGLPRGAWYLQEPDYYRIVGDKREVRTAARRVLSVIAKGRGNAAEDARRALTQLSQGPLPAQ